MTPEEIFEIPDDVEIRLLNGKVGIMLIWPQQDSFCGICVGDIAEHYPDIQWVPASKLEISEPGVIIEVP